MKNRLLFDEIKKYTEHKNALIITGMRQVGKTILMKSIFKHLGDKPKVWFDFDNPLDQKIFEDLEYKNIYKVLKDLSKARGDDRIFVFIDEIQNFPEATKVVKYLIDHYSVKFFITGSSSFYLKNLFPESLSGRKFLYELNPLSFREYLYFKGRISRERASELDISIAVKKKNIVEFKSFQADYNDYLQFGGFPEVVMTEDMDTKKQVLKNIFASFFEKDLKIMSDYKDIRELRDLILLLVPRVGSMMDVTKLASELGVDRPKIYSYLEFLQGTFFIKLLPKFSKSVDRAVASGKKVYFSDTGILNIIGQVNDAQIFENAAINQLSNYEKVSFYNKKNTNEIDAILNKKIAFEIKTKGIPADLIKLNKIIEKIGIKEGFIISKEYADFDRVVFPMFL
ncbi:MAG: ATPase [Candidatus Moranbacteria bacterium GW2011_GWA2_39_41]|nr:MAG: ATPase [Candidatus Moranbacteria bacterium GW2011_GWA2_39_41]